MGDADLDATPGVRVTTGEGEEATVRRVGWIERQVRWADRFQQRHEEKVAASFTDEADEDPEAPPLTRPKLPPDG
jgi:hypothetical protein